MYSLISFPQIVHDLRANRLESGETLELRLSGKLKNFLSVDPSPVTGLKGSFLLMFRQKLNLREVGIEFPNIYRVSSYGKTSSKLVSTARL